MNPELEPSVLLAAYAQGVFPMADDEDRVQWYTADPRAIFDLENFHVPRSLRQVWRQKRFKLSVNRDFRAVIAACADRPDGTWISREIQDAYLELHHRGFAHSVEAWHEGRLAVTDRLVGGLYGVALGGAFFGESMFHRETNASKVALVHLVEQLRLRGFRLLDTQFSTAHLKQFNCIEIPRREYLRRLSDALELDVRFAD
jgi:leucyl/phenylalanyl-tRNA--protein transferase